MSFEINKMVEDEAFGGMRVQNACTECMYRMLAQDACTECSYRMLKRRVQDGCPVA